MMTHKLSISTDSDKDDDDNASFVNDFDVDAAVIDHIAPKKANKAYIAEHYNSEHGFTSSHYEAVFKFRLNAGTGTITIPQRNKNILQYETKIIDDGMMQEINLKQNINIQQILSPFLSNETTIKMFKYKDKHLAFLVFQINNEIIKQSVEQIRSTFPRNASFHGKQIESSPHYDPYLNTVYLQSKTGNTDINLMRNNYDLIKAQQNVLDNVYKLLFGKAVNKTNRYLTNWLDITQNKWLIRNIYTQVSNLTVSQIKEVINSDAIHQDTGYELTFTLFLTSDNYDGYNQTNYNQGMYFVTHAHKINFLLRLKSEGIMFAIFPSQMEHFTESATVNEDETVNNVFDDKQRVWRLSSIMQTCSLSLDTSVYGDNIDHDMCTLSQRLSDMI